MTDRKRKHQQTEEQRKGENKHGEKEIHKCWPTLDLAFSPFFYFAGTLSVIIT